jgi:hypothetical protein
VSRFEGYGGASMTGLTMPLSTRPTPGTHNDRRSWDILDAHGRLIAVVASDHFESARYRCFDAEAVARLWTAASNLAHEPKTAEVTV